MNSDSIAAYIKQLEQEKADLQQQLGNWQRFREEIAPLIECEPNDIPNDTQQAIDYILNSVSAMQEEERNYTNIANELAEALQNIPPEVDSFVDLVIQRYSLDKYKGDNFRLAPDAMQEIIRALWAIRPEMKEGAA